MAYPSFVMASFALLKVWQQNGRPLGLFVDSCAYRRKSKQRESRYHSVCKNCHYLSITSFLVVPRSFQAQTLLHKMGSPNIRHAARMQSTSFPSLS